MVNIKKALKMALLVALSFNPQTLAHTTKAVSTSKLSKSIKKSNRKFTKGNYEDYFDALAHRESSNNHRVESRGGYLGKYQLGEMALIEAGFYKDDGDKARNNWRGGWTAQAVKANIRSKRDFLNNQEAQDIAVRAYTEKNWRIIKYYGLDEYVGRKVGDVEVTISGMLAGAHLVGVSNLREFLEHGTDATDGNGVNISTYIKHFNSYETPFEKKLAEERVA